MSRQDVRGFSLVELLIVIVILGVVAGVVAFAVGGIADSGRASGCAQDASTLVKAEESHYAMSGSYGDDAALVSDGLLRAPSSMHSITVGGGTYTVVGIGQCAVAGGSSPSVLPVTGAAQWDDASDASSVTQSGGGSPYVTSWGDKSGSGAALANGTSSSSITYSANAINGHPAIVTTGSAVLSNNTTYGPQSTAFVVAKMTGAAKQRILSGLNNNWLLGWWWGYENQAYFNGWLHQPSTAATTNAIVYSATTGNGQATFWRNGTQLASSSGGFASPAGLQVGGGYFGGTEYSAANIGEVIIYNRILTVSERQSVESYLAGKWGVPPGG